MSLTRSFTFAALFATLSTAAAAAPIPGVRGIDHIGFTVPDADAAVTFFHDVIGCEEAFRFGPIKDEQGTLMQDLVNVNPRAEIQHIVMMRCGQGSNIELFQYASPDQRDAIPKNSDIGGHHIAFYVKDLPAALARAKELGVKTFMGPFAVNEGPAAGQSITYVLTPWGMQLELISYPKGMAYEKKAKVKLWAPASR
ncbi:glyoxalase [Azoarcus indigens]|uniref:Catechol 2,3-dioxygenase-like lactoylglutathione lyase family enzyme n=1 Tax=Azoarcus indigens TaxID=29545 RepID=A0A4R6DPP5_9RHOO|nr:VOC family protein [Azoarcus indigens]NMG68070.1 glyoxalase [Azoarcus indigens]TDN46843.1 catechol 2,3-dioxygenase-like lactoylglutathione lyase family enzyme [Azoarcus indigens]